MIPYTWQKSAGFSFFPDGTEKVYDAGKWALYYIPQVDMSFVVIDFQDHWKINHYLGRLKVSYTRSVMASKPCCNE